MSTPEGLAQLNAYWLQQYKDRFIPPWILNGVYFSHESSRPSPWGCRLSLQGPLTPEVDPKYYTYVEFIDYYDLTPDKAIIGAIEKAYGRVRRYNQMCNQMAVNGGVVFGFNLLSF